MRSVGGFCFYAARVLVILLAKGPPQYARAEPGLRIGGLNIRISVIRVRGHRLRGNDEYRKENLDETA
jgi:hypothetical protein